MTEDAAELRNRIDEAVGKMLQDGCPCRFPRFRAMVARDTQQAGFACFTSEEQPMLIDAYVRAVPLVNGRCVRCGALAVRWAWEFGKTAFVEYMRFEDSTLSDLGAPASSPIPRCRPFYATGFATKAQRKKVERFYPRLTETDWLSWLLERAG
jgi:hypothetical protein